MPAKRVSRSGEKKVLMEQVTGLRREIIGLKSQITVLSLSREAVVEDLQIVRDARRDMEIIMQEQQAKIADREKSLRLLKDEITTATEENRLLRAELVSVKKKLEKKEMDSVVAEEIARKLEEIILEAMEK